MRNQKISTMRFETANFESVVFCMKSIWFLITCSLVSPGAFQVQSSSWKLEASICYNKCVFCCVLAQQIASLIPLPQSI